MPDIPLTIEQEIALDKNSRRYRAHPLVSVRQFCKLSYNDQRRVDREAEELAAGLRKWVTATADAPAHWLLKQGTAWVPPA